MTRASAALFIVLLIGPETINAQLLPIDFSVKAGTLENGLRYYIRFNGVGRREAEFRLVVKAGSVLEEDDQQGLAHFLEHLAFNSTERFPNEKIIDVMQNMGLEFGADLNAYTSFDETVYFLPIPTVPLGNIETVMQIMSDWAHQIVFDPNEIEEERGVVLEEFRFSGDAFQRVFNRLLPIRFRDSRYAVRPPIGQVAVIDTFHHERLESFYRDWYRPDLMAVIAVGDFSGVPVENLIKEYFGSIPGRPEAPERPVFRVPDHEETLYGVASDPELPFPYVQVDYKRDVPGKNTEQEYRRELVERMIQGLVESRLAAASNGTDPPFTFASAYEFNLLAKETYVSWAVVGDSGVEVALEGLLIEMERLKRFGFGGVEFLRQKEILLAEIEKEFNDWYNRPSFDYAQLYTNHFLRGDAIPGEWFAWDFAQRVVPAIFREEVDAAVRELLSEHNRVITAAVPELPDTLVPDPSLLEAVVKKVQAMDLEPTYEDNLANIPLIDPVPEGSLVINERYVVELNLTEWRLANGALVVLLPNNFNEILLLGSSPGGYSLASNEDFFPAFTSDLVVRESGVGPFSKTDLGKRLAGQNVDVFPWIVELQEGVEGFSTTADFETALQLIYLYFTAPRRDEQAFENYQNRLRANYSGGTDPHRALFDSLDAILAQHHPRGRPFSLEAVEEMDLDKSMTFYRDRYADASDFVFFFTGNIDPPEVRPLIETYIGGLPSTNRNENWRDHGIRPPSGIVERTLFQGTDERSLSWLVLAYSGLMEWTRQERIMLDALGQYLDIRAFQVLRQKLGKTYSGGASVISSRYPEPTYRLILDFATDPNDLEAVTDALFEVIDDLRTNGPKSEDIETVKNQLLLNEENDLWYVDTFMYKVADAYFHRDDPVDILYDHEIIEEINGESLHAAAQRYLPANNYVHLQLLPESFADDTVVMESYGVEIPELLVLGQNFPNPFNSATTVPFSLPKAENVSVELYNIAGQKVATLVDRFLEVGSYTLQWDGKDDQDRTLASGIYLYRLNVGAKLLTRKLILLQ